MLRIACWCFVSSLCTSRPVLFDLSTAALYGSTVHSSAVELYRINSLQIPRAELFHPLSDFDLI